MITISLEQGSLVITAGDGILEPKHENQLAYWGFLNSGSTGNLICNSGEINTLLPKIVAYFERVGLSFRLNDSAKAVLTAHEGATELLNHALTTGTRLKNAQLNASEKELLSSFLNSGTNRPLKLHQCKAALHLLSTVNGANFSVPGSGKTAVVLAVFDLLKRGGEVDSLFVVGPPACFGPWRSEYKEVLGVEPSYEILAGGDIDTRHSKYFVTNESASDLYLTTFQTIQRDWERVKLLFENQGVKFYFVVDEAHYIKQIGGAWATAVLNVANHASRKCILTGTPFPRTYSDAFNLFDVLWPESSPISGNERHAIELYTQRKENERAAEILDSSIGPLFYRVRKEDLGLAEQIMEDPTMIRMNEHERNIYDSVVDRIRDVSKEDYFRNIELLQKLRRGRMIRLRQCISYVGLLRTAIEDYDEDLLADNPSLSDIISHYDELEIPAKLTTLLNMVKQLVADGEKVVIWANFIKTLHLVERSIENEGYGVRLIYGQTPTEQTRVQEELTREEIIKEFVDPSSGVDVLVANPAACAESISLHKTCSHAIYYDLSYNCAQYLQSLDRIHRVGGSEETPAHYYFLQYENTIDSDILANVRRKAENMYAILDKDYAIISLDMFDEDEELQAYGTLFQQ